MTLINMDNECGCSLKLERLFEDKYVHYYHEFVNGIKYIDNVSLIQIENKSREPA